MTRRLRGPGLGLALGLVACNTQTPADPGQDGGSSGSSTSTGSAVDSSGSNTNSGIPGLCESGDDGWVSATSGGDSGGQGSGGAEESGFGMGDDMPLLTDLYDVNQSGVQSGDRIEVRDVIVTSPVSLSETGAAFEFFVQEQASGPYSGIRIRTNSNLIQQPEPGDVLVLVGQVRGQDQHQVIQVNTSGLEFVGTAPLPDPLVLSTEELEDPDSETALAYEGVVVAVEGVTVTNSGACAGEFEVDSVLRVDDRFLAGGLPTPSAGESFASLSGPLIYVLDSEDEGLELAPRDSGDVQQ